MELGGMLRLSLLMLVLVINIECCYGCWEQERIALLQLKASITHPNSTDSLPSWKDEEEGTSDCCEWERIECHNITRRVIKLLLNQTWHGYRYLNASVFLPFESLRSLDLSGNLLCGCVENEGFEKLRRLRNLEVLLLNDNNFNNSILSSLNGLSTLVTLHLSRNNLNGAIRTQGFKSAPRLNSSFLRGFPSLKALYLRRNGLNGTIRSQGFCELRALQHLDLSFNKLEGNLPWCLANLTSLQFLDLSLNQFTGNIASSPLIQMTSLEHLVLSSNRFQVPISFQSFFNHSKLKIIESLDNQLLAEMDFQTLPPSFKLTGIRLSHGAFGNVSSSRALPNFLYYQKDLQKVELSQINFDGKFPNWLLENNTGLVLLFLPSNSFSGYLQLPFHPKKQLLALDISNNNFQGHIPSNISMVFPALKLLMMSENGFHGSIPSSLGNMSSLESLDLSNNQLSGEIPDHLTMGCFFLRYLKLSYNNLQGPILPKKSTLTMLDYLFLDHNNFTEISYSLSKSSFLKFLNISQNHLSGKLPEWMGSMSHLFVIAMSGNHLEGSIPTEFCKLHFLKVFDFSENNITGTIPSCFNTILIQHIHLSKNRLQGPLSHAFYNSSSLVILDLSHNNLTGHIPNWIGSLSSLSTLVLQNNNFEGEIPVSLCHMSQLRLLDLSCNNFSGHIPPCLSNMTFEGIPEKTSTKSNFGILTSEEGMLDEIRIKPFLDPKILDPQVQVAFTIKGMSRSYKGIDLDLFSAIDLSCNKLTGDIPYEFGSLDQIRSLNLSHNGLSGTIPRTFSNLNSIESLDISFNNLSGKIPLHLTELHFLAKFNVSYNHLSGKIPRSTQFDTFDNNSYIGNPLLCGPPVSRICTSVEPSRVVMNSSEVYYGFMDMESFYVSFTVSYITMFLGVAVVFYINPYWRRAWIHLVEVCITSCYYFVVDNFQKVFC